MATVLRAPFRVPRPPDDPVWQGGRARESHLLAPLLTAAGQPRQPGRRFEHDDAAQWPGKPLPSWLTRFAPAASPFAPPPRAVAPDDAPPWMGRPDRSAPLRLLTAQRIFGAGGEVAPFRWNCGIDAGLPWTGRPIRSVTLAAFGRMPPQVRPGGGAAAEENAWQAASRRNLQLLAPSAPFGRIFRQDVGSAEAPWRLPGAPVSLLSLPAAAPLLPSFWRCHTDCAAVWSGAPDTAPALFLPPPPALSPNPFRTLANEHVRVRTIANGDVRVRTVANGRARVRSLARTS